jgi:site-specific recombinase XerD
MSGGSKARLSRRRARSSRPDNGWTDSVHCRPLLALAAVASVAHLQKMPANSASLREQEPDSPFIFTSERGAPFTPAGFRKMVARLGVAAGFGFPVHPHMLRHACGFKLANDGVDTRSLQGYLGHRNIQHTVRYTELVPTRFKNFWQD